MAQKFLVPIDLNKNELQNARIQNLAAAPGSPVEGLIYYDTVLHQMGVYQNTTWIYFTASGGGTVTAVSVASANGFAGTSSGGATPALTLTTTITGILKGNGTAISAATSGTDYLIPSNTTFIGTTSIAFNRASASQALTGITSIDGSAATLTTSRNIYGNAFNGSTDITAIIASTFGGTGNGFTKFTGPATTEKTFTLPNASDTIVCYGTAGSFTAVQTFGAAGNVGKLAIAGTTSGSTILNASAVASGTLTLPAATDTLVGRATADTLTNKSIDASTNTITNLTTAMFATNVVDTDGTLTANSTTRIPTQSAVKTYVDTNIQGVKWKNAVRAATTANGTLATAFANGQVIDGVTLVTGDRILLKDQTTGQDNGIYTVNASGAPTRAIDADTAAEVLQFVVSVSEGTINADKTFVNSTNAAITLGTTPLVIVDFVTTNVPLASTSVAGKVTLATLAEAEAKSDTAKAVVSADLLNFPIKRLFTIGDGTSTSLTCTHNLGTKDVMVQVRDASTDAVVITDIVNTSTTVTTITFAVAPATNAYKVVIIG